MSINASDIHLKLKFRCATTITILYCTPQTCNCATPTILLLVPYIYPGFVFRASDIFWCSKQKQSNHEQRYNEKKKKKPLILIRTYTVYKKEADQLIGCEFGQNFLGRIITIDPYI